MDIQFYDKHPATSDAASELMAGLTAHPRSIPPKFFYDERGSELFTEITRQPEYYPTRTEIGLLEALGGELRALVGEDTVLVEYGSGSSEKIRLLLEGLRPRVYAPLDISKEYLARSASDVATEFPWLEVRAVCIDYTKDFELPFELEGNRLGFFPGSSIGNFSRPDAADFLSRVQTQLGTGAGLLIGVDMKKDLAVLERAYNDAAGVTAEFNLNVLEHLNRDYGADFHPRRFDHVAEYNEQEGCVQMFLVSKEDQQVTIAETRLDIAEGERIHTENSHKYSRDEFGAMAEEAGFEVRRCWQDDNGWFSVFYLLAV